MSSTEPNEPRHGLRGDLHRAREGAFATSAELHEFIRTLKGKSPQEVLGAVANSGLTQGVALATLGTIAFFAFFTIGPYYWYPKPVPVVKKEAETTPAANTAAPAANTPAPAEASKTASPNAASNAQQTLEKLGESETKNADPKVNPLDNLDDLLETKKK